MLPPPVPPPQAPLVIPVKSQRRLTDGKLEVWKGFERFSQRAGARQRLREPIRIRQDLFLNRSNVLNRGVLGANRILSSQASRLPQAHLSIANLQ